MTHDSLWQAFRSMSTKEANAFLEQYVAGLPGRIEDFLEEAGKRGAPVEQLDFTRESLVPLWSWFIASQQLPQPRATEEEMRASNPPWWFELLPPLGTELGPDLARFVTLLAAYLGETIKRERPGSKWGFERHRGDSERNEPRLEIADGMYWAVDTSLVSIVLNALRPKRLQAHPEGLRNVFDVVAPAPGTPPRTWGQARRPFDVAATELPGFTHEVGFEDVVAREEESRVARFVQLLGRKPGITRVEHEDREIVLVNAPGLREQQLEPVVAGTWSEAGGPN
jgi:hypothetical protein